MWAEYAPCPGAVALETTIHALQAALGADFMAAPVQYIDRESTRLPNSTLNALEPFFFKGLDFEWERELRFIGNMELGTPLGSPRRMRLEPGQVPVRFIVAPSAPPGL